MALVSVVDSVATLSSQREATTLDERTKSS